MSIIYCHQCDRNIDTDFEAEHWDSVHNKAVDYQRYFEVLVKQLHKIVTDGKAAADAGGDDPTRAIAAAREFIVSVQTLDADTQAFAEKLKLENAVHALDKFKPKGNAPL